MLPHRLVVPLFQRPYVWNQENQWEPLWGDVMRVRNVEAGVLIRDRHFTAQLRAHFDGLVQAKQVARLPGF